MAATNELRETLRKYGAVDWFVGKGEESALDAFRGERCCMGGTAEGEGDGQGGQGRGGQGAARRIVYLSPDAAVPLRRLRPGRDVYVIGGIVDRSVRKYESLRRAREMARREAATAAAAAAAAETAKVGGGESGEAEGVQVVARRLLLPEFFSWAAAANEAEAREMVQSGPLPPSSRSPSSSSLAAGAGAGAGSGVGAGERQWRGRGGGSLVREIEEVRAAKRKIEAARVRAEEGSGSKAAAAVAAAAAAAAATVG